MTAEEATALYDCLESKMNAAYKGGGHWAVNRWSGFENVASQPYPSATHGNRFVINAVNKIGAEAYKLYEDVQAMPIGSTIVKPSFTLSSAGQASLGPFFVMEKMTNGFNEQSADWRYAMVMPGGQTAGVTGGPNSAAMNFCVECHNSAEDNDQLFFLPEDVRN